MKKPKVNCLTRCLWHWEKYGGEIIYDSSHATIRNSSVEYIDGEKMGENPLDIREYGISTIRNNHSDFMTPRELKLLRNYFRSKP